MMAAAEVSRLRKCTPSSTKSYHGTPSSGRRGKRYPATFSAVASRRGSLVSAAATEKPYRAHAAPRDQVVSAAKPWWVCVKTFSPGRAGFGNLREAFAPCDEYHSSRFSPGSYCTHCPPDPPYPTTPPPP